MPTTSSPAPAGRATPWYREPWPWLLMAGPAVVVVAAFVTLWLAVSTEDGVVADDYYKRGLVINKLLAREDRAVALQLAADVEIGSDGAVRLALSGNVPAAAPETIRLRLSHATRSGLDRSSVLQRGSDGTYRGRIDPPETGRWLIVAETDEWRLPALEISGKPETLHLGAKRSGG